MLYLHTPIITASDCEGAGEMFQVTTLSRMGARNLNLRGARRAKSALPGPHKKARAERARAPGLSVQVGYSLRIHAEAPSLSE